MLRRACRRLLFLREWSVPRAPGGQLPPSKARFAAASSVSAQTFCHVLSGLNCFIALAVAAPFGPRFFWYTTPS